MKAIIITITLTLLTGCLFSTKEKEAKEEPKEDCRPRVDSRNERVDIYCYPADQEFIDPSIPK